MCRVQDAIGEKLSLGNNLQLSSNQTWLLKSAHLQGRPFEAADLSGIHVSLQHKFARILISGQTSKEFRGEYPLLEEAFL